VADSNQLTKALIAARAAQAAQLDAVLSLQNIKFLRLDALQATVLPLISGHPDAKALFELNVQQGPNPRLWIDLISSVVMEPDPQTYRLVQDQNGMRETLHETRNLAEMTSFITKYLAHRLLAHSRAEAGLKIPPSPQNQGYSVWEMAYVWFTGCAFGALVLLLGAMLLGKLHF
jgi:hypothetical protein